MTAVETLFENIYSYSDFFLFSYYTFIIFLFNKYRNSTLFTKIQSKLNNHYFWITKSM